MRLIVRPLDPLAFAPFGAVSAAPTFGARTVVAPVGPCANLRPGRATSRLAWFAVPASGWPFTATVMERHRFSSQSFVPCGPATWLVLVAPRAAAADGPNMTAAVAFVAAGGQAVTFNPDTWHHPLTAFATAYFAVQTFLADDPDDEEFYTLPGPMTILPG